MGAVQPEWDEAFLKEIFLQTVKESVGVKLFKNNLLNNRLNRRPIGYAFIEFATSEAATKAKESLTNQKIPGTNVLFRLNWAVRDKKRATKQQENNEHAMFVGDLAEEVSDEMLLTVFQEKFASCTSASVVIDPTTGHSKKYGFVRFRDIEDYQNALNTMNGFVVGSREIRVGQATSKHTARALTNFMNQPYRQPYPIQHHPTNMYHAMYNPPTQLKRQEYNVDYTTMCTIFISNLEETVEEKELETIFGAHGQIKTVNLKQYNPGFASIIYDTPLEAQRACGAMNGTKVGSLVVKVNLGQSQQSWTTPKQQYSNIMYKQQHQQAVNVMNMQDMSTLNYVSNINTVGSMGLGATSMAYNTAIKYVSFIGKPNVAQVGYMNVPPQIQQSHLGPYVNQTNFVQQMENLNLQPQSSTQPETPEGTDMKTFDFNFK